MLITAAICPCSPGTGLADRFTVPRLHATYAKYCFPIATSYRRKRRNCQPASQKQHQNGFSSPMGNRRQTRCGFAKEELQRGRTPVGCVCSGLHGSRSGLNLVPEHVEQFLDRHAARRFCWNAPPRSGKTGSQGKTGCVVWRERKAGRFIELCKRRREISQKA